jgi:DNA-binding CsgD family transcriptional regulator
VRQDDGELRGERAGGVHGSSLPPQAQLVNVISSRALSRREREVAALVARGLSNRAIAAELSIAEKTAANHIEHIMAKLDLRSRAQIAVWAVRRDLAADGPAGRG